MLFEFGNFRVDIDVERTKAFYNTLGKTVLEDCGCVNCRNYYEAISKTSDKVKSFFASLGIDPKKSPEATWWDTNEKGIAYYTMIFHLVGTIINAVDIYEYTGDGGVHHVLENYYEVDKDFQVGFTSKTALLEKDFPQPCIQLEIEARIPWVLN